MLAAVPNLHFYNSQLLNGTSAEQRPALTPNLPPLVFVDVRGQQQGMHGSLANLAEASTVASALVQLSPCIGSHSLGVICFYRAQVNAELFLRTRAWCRAWLSCQSGDIWVHGGYQLESHVAYAVQVDMIQEQLRKRVNSSAKLQPESQVSTEAGGALDSVEVATVDSFQVLNHAVADCVMLMWLSVQAGCVRLET